MTKAVNIPPEACAGLDAVRGAIARRVRALRQARGWSMDEFCRRSGMGKGLLVDTERGTANPSIATLCKAAAALGVSVAEIVEVEAVPDAPAEVGSLLWVGEHGGRGVLLVGTPGPGRLKLWRWTLMPGERHHSDGHATGTTELLHVDSGVLTFLSEGKPLELGRSQSALVPADRVHGYENRGSAAVTFTMIVLEPDVSRE